jgi:NADH:ubiquinone oxidoreductase subunit K
MYVSCIALLSCIGLSKIIVCRSELFQLLGGEVLLLQVFVKQLCSSCDVLPCCGFQVKDQG